MFFTSQIFVLNHTSPHIGLVKNQKPFIFLFYQTQRQKISCPKISFIEIKNIFEIYFNFILTPIEIIGLCRTNYLNRKDGDMYSKNLLWDLRTKLPMQFVLMNLENVLQIPFKESEGFIRFLCPSCNEMQSTINPKNNLSHCFSCKKNFNNIDLLMFNGYSFSSSVEMLICQWDELKKRSQTKAETLAWLNSNPPTNIGEKL